MKSIEVLSVTEEAWCDVKGLGHSKYGGTVRPVRSSVSLKSLHLPKDVHRYPQPLIGYTADSLPLRVAQSEVGEPSLDLGDGVVDGLSHVVDVAAGQTAHVDAAARHQEHVPLFDHELHLFGCNTHHNTERVTRRGEEEPMQRITQDLF